MNETRLVLEGTIDRTFAEDVLHRIGHDVPDDCEHLHVTLQSPGGSVPIALAVAELLLSLPCRVTTLNPGRVDSAALLVFAAGDTRLCTPDAGFLAHPVGRHMTGLQTRASLMAQLRGIEEDTRRTIAFLAQQTRPSAASTWRRLMARQTVVGAERALRLGLVHAVVESTEERMGASDDVAENA